jgi:hypothetical protein
MPTPKTKPASPEQSTKTATAAAAAQTTDIEPPLPDLPEQEEDMEEPIRPDLSHAEIMRRRVFTDIVYNFAFQIQHSKFSDPVEYAAGVTDIIPHFQRREFGEALGAVLEFVSALKQTFDRHADNSPQTT